jgi:hypothetical protein
MGMKKSTLSTNRFLFFPLFSVSFPSFFFNKVIHEINIFFLVVEGRTKKNRPTQLEWRTNGIQSFIGWLLFLSFSIGWTVFIPGPKKRKQIQDSDFANATYRCNEMGLMLVYYKIISFNLMEEWMEAKFNNNEYSC